MNRLDRAVRDNLKDQKYQINEVINSDAKLGTSSFNLSEVTSDLLRVVTVSIQVRKKHGATDFSGLICLWDSGATNRMLKILHTKHYERKIQSNKVDYITTAGVYFTTHDVKVPFFMTEFSSSKIINHRFHIDNDKCESGIVYDMIIGRDLMVQLGLMANFNRQFLQWDGATFYIKDPSSLIWKPDLPKREIREVMMQNVEPASTREATDRIVKIIDSTYAKSDLEHTVANANQLNDEERNLLLSIIEDFKELFDGTLGNWATESFDL